MKRILIFCGIIFLFAVAFSCKSQSKKTFENVLQPINVAKVKVPEPSGLCFDESTKSLWTVSDETSLLYNIDTNGNLIKTVSVDGIDLEGITFVNDTTIAIVLERSREVVLLNKLGKELSKFQLDLKGNLNSGLEGIAFNPKNNHLYLINEKNPSLLLETSLSGEKISERNMKIAKDLSGLAYDVVNDELWIISDENRALYKCKTDGTVIDKYLVDIKQIEGIAFDFKNDKLYLVSDKTEKLYAFDIP